MIRTGSLHRIPPSVEPDMQHPETAWKLDPPPYTRRRSSTPEAPPWRPAAQLRLYDQIRLYDNLLPIAERSQLPLFPLPFGHRFSVPRATLNAVLL